MKLYYYYDQEADVLYFSQGKPSAKDQSEEAPHDTIIRVNPRTHAVKGFTLLNFTRRLRQGNTTPVSLPIDALLTPSSR